MNMNNKLSVQLHAPEKRESRFTVKNSAHLFVRPLCYAEQEEEEPYKANAHQEAQRYHGDDQRIRPGPAPQGHRQQFIG